MINKNEFKCPECGSDVSVWADIDAMVTFKVSKNGKLVKREIENTFQTDGRCGVKCISCDWDFNHLDDGSDYRHFLDLADQALEYQHQVHFLTIKSRGK